MAWSNEYIGIFEVSRNSRNRIEVFDGPDKSFDFLAFYAFAMPH